jgi:predicted Zn-ribbon and HTH transcriptional regulator
LFRDQLQKRHGAVNSSHKQKRMLYSYKISRAIRFSIQTHEVYQKQKRKGKDIPYITHPLTVGLILSRAGADEDTVVAGILHDTIEDSIPEKKVSREMFVERFGEKVADIVESVSEPNKKLSWEKRKQEALERIRSFSHQSLLVKSADIISNASELVEDYKQEGDVVFSRFNAPKKKLLQHYLHAITAVIEQWSESPLVEDLQSVARELQSIGAFVFVPQYHAKVIEYADYSVDMPLQCPVCGWRGTPKESGWIEHHDDLLDVSCPNCEKMLLVVSYPLIK